MSAAPRPSMAWLRWLPFLVWVGLIVGFLRPGSPGFAWVGKQPWGDKATHVLVIGVLAFLFDVALSGRRVRLFGWAVPLATVLAAGFMTAEELSQLGFPGRKFEWGDLACNYVGIAAAGAASAWLFRRRPAGDETAR